MSKAREHVRAPNRLRDDFDNENSSHDEGVGDEGAMTAPWGRLGAHDRGAAAAGYFNQPLEALGEGRRLHVIRVTTEAFVAPAGVRRVLTRVAQPSERL